MGFLNNFFKKKPADFEVQSFKPANFDNLSSKTTLGDLDEFILTMDDTEKERIIDKMAKDNYLIGNFEHLRNDILILDAARLVVNNQEATNSILIFNLHVGSLRAERIIDQLEKNGIIGPSSGSSPRTILFKKLSDLEDYLRKNPLLKSKSVLFYEKNKEEIEVRRAEYLKNQQMEMDRLEKEAIKLQMIDNERKKRLHKEALNELIATGEMFNYFTNKEGKRESIPQDVMDKVWNRDNGKCAKCGSQENLEFDHIIPFSKGGATTYRNTQLLCKKCNVEKSNKIG
jgi:hypothetical protein